MTEAVAAAVKLGWPARSLSTARVQSLKLHPITPQAMDQLPVAHAELRHDSSASCAARWCRPWAGRTCRTASLWRGPQALRPIVTWGGSRWAKAAHIPPHRLIDLSETFKAATGFQLGLAPLVRKNRAWPRRCGS